MNLFGLACIIWVACGIAAWLATLYRYYSRFTFTDALAIIPAMVVGPIALALFCFGLWQDHLRNRCP